MSGLLEENWFQNNNKLLMIDDKKCNILLEKHIDFSENMQENLSCKHFGGIKVENIKEEVQTGSQGRDSCDNEHGKQIPFECDVALIKKTSCDDAYENYNLEVNYKGHVKKEDDEIELENHDFTYEQLQSIKSEVIKEAADLSDEADCDSEYSKKVSIRCDVSFTKNDTKNMKPTKHIKESNDAFACKYFEIKCIGNTKWYHCCFCSYRTKHRGSLTKHSKRKHDEEAEWYQCYSCEYRTKIKVDLATHCKVRHSKHVQRYLCLHCSFKTKSETLLTKHFKRMHDEVQLYSCYSCNYKTKRKDRLADHCKCRHGKHIKWLLCQFCEFGTKYKRSLLNHFKSQHSSEVLHCDLCNYKTKDKKFLFKHYECKHDNSIQ